MLTKMCNQNDGAWAGMNQSFMTNPNRSRSAACGNYYAIDWWVLHDDLQPQHSPTTLLLVTVKLANSQSFQL
jgi:hypothetical protein